MDQSTIIYMSITSLIALMLLANTASYGSLAGVVIILSLLTIVIIIMINYIDFLLFPIFTRIIGLTVIPAKNYFIPKRQDSIIKYISGIYYATGYLTANIYNYVFQAEEVAQGEDTSMSIAPDNWEKAIMNIDFPFRYNVISAVHEIQSYREELEGKRGFFEFQYGREMAATNPNPVNIEDLQRKMRIVQARIDRLGQGERPVSSMMYIETTAVGVSEKEAIDKLSDQLNQLQTVFNVFDLSIARIYGREMYFLHKLNYVVPEMGEIASNFQVQR